MCANYMFSCAVMIAVVGTIISPSVWPQSVPDRHTFQGWEFAESPDNPDNIPSTFPANPFGTPFARLAGENEERIWLEELDGLSGILVTLNRHTEFVIPNLAEEKAVKTLNLSVIYQYVTDDMPAVRGGRFADAERPKVEGLNAIDEVTVKFRRLRDTDEELPGSDNWRLYQATFRTPATFNECPFVEVVTVPARTNENFLMIADIDIETWCEEDCNSNGIPDPEEIDTGSAEDENNNQIPDECEHICIACALEGTTQGGSVAVTVDGFFASCSVSVGTVAGQPSTMVVTALAGSINGDQCFLDQGISAAALGRNLQVCSFALTGDAVQFNILDAGLAAVEKIPTLSTVGMIILGMLLVVFGLRWVSRV